MKPCPVCSEIIQAIAKIAMLRVGDDLKLFLIGAALDYEPAPRKRRRRKRRADVVKLVPHSDPPRAS
jgi:hypothetical protein